MKNNNTILNMVLTLVIIAVISAGAMSYVNKITSPIIAANDGKQLQISLKKVIDATDFKEIKADDEATIYEASKNGEQVGYCVIDSSKGYGGELRVMTGIDKDIKVTGVEILSQSETAGLGANSAKQEFRDQYVDKKQGIGVAKNSPSDNEIQAISGATITSKAVTEAVNKALETIQKGEF